MIKVLEREFLIKILNHYCDSVWEYDRKSCRFFIHYDKLATDYAEKYWTVDELREIFKKKILPGSDLAVYEKFLTKEYLQSFFDNDVKNDSFFLRFRRSSGEMKWYDICVERENDEKLLITGRDVRKMIPKQGLVGGIDAACDSILNIDVETKNYIISYPAGTEFSGDTFMNYDNAAEKLVEKYCAASEKKSDRGKDAS